MAGNAIRLSDDLIESVRDEASAMTRSITGQVEHWLRLGRALERSPTFSYDRIRKTLEGEASPDSLSDDENELYEEMFSQAMWSASAEGEADDAYYEKMKAKHEARGLDIAALGDATRDAAL